MKGNEYNDLWAVISNVETSLYDRLPRSSDESSYSKTTEYKLRKRYR